MDHFTSLVVIACVVVVALLYSHIHARAKLGNMEFELKANRDKKEKPGREPDSSSSKNT